MQFINPSVAKTMSRSQLVEMKTLLTNELSEVKAKIDEAKQIAYHNGTYVAPEKWKKMNDYYKVLNIQLRNVDTELSVRRQRQLELHDALPAKFLECAKEYLDEYDYKNIMEMARQRTVGK